MLGEAVRAQDFLGSLRALQSEARRLVDVYRGYDLILTPTLGTPPARIGELQPRGADRIAQKVIAALNWKAPLSNTKLVDQAAQSTYSFIPFSPVANFTVQPSMSVPLYWSAEGLPIGVMFNGHPAEEKRMFALAAQLERASLARTAATYLRWQQELVDDYDMLKLIESSFIFWLPGVPSTP